MPSVQFLPTPEKAAGITILNDLIVEFAIFHSWNVSFSFRSRINKFRACHVSFVSEKYHSLYLSESDKQIFLKSIHKIEEAVIFPDLFARHLNIENIKWHPTMYPYSVNFVFSKLL